MSDASFFHEPPVELPADPAAPVELRGAAVGERWLASAIEAARVSPVTPDELPRSMEWIRAALAERPTLPPPAVVLDIARLALGEPLRYGAPLPIEAPELVEAVRSYDDQVLGRLAADPRIEEVGTALSRTPEDRLPAAIALLVDGILRRIAYGGGVSFGPGVIRQLERRNADEVKRVGAEALADDDPPIALMARAYRQLVTAARAHGALLDDALVFQLANFDTLGTATRRMAAEQVLTAASTFESVLPRRIQRRLQRVAHVATTVEDESQFPAGGFSEIWTSGSMENLVASELVYLEDDRGDSGFDLFDVRFVEGELLFYKRDESVHTRARRQITFALLPSLLRARVMAQGLPHQRLICALGMVRALLSRLCEWLSTEALSIDLVWIEDEDGNQPLADELALCEVLLEQWRSKGVTRLVTLPTAEAAFDYTEERARNAVADLVWIDIGAPAQPVAPPFERQSYRALQVHVLDLARPTPRLFGPAAEVELDADPRTAWLTAARALADVMVV